MTGRGWGLRLATVLLAAAKIAKRVQIAAAFGATPGDGVAPLDRRHYERERICG